VVDKVVVAVLMLVMVVLVVEPLQTTPLTVMVMALLAKEMMVLMGQPLLIMGLAEAVAQVRQELLEQRLMVALAVLGNQIV